jgi:CubicO group peptidase (beta-lactamase class C family)
MSHKFHAFCLKFSTVLFFMLLLQPAFAQSLTELDDVVLQKQKQIKTDVVLMVADKDTIIYNKDTKIFSSLRGQAPIAASSEWLTAALVMTMVDEGKISLDDRVSRYLPEFARYGKNYITIRHCLSHFTGIQAEAPKLKKMFEKKKFESLEAEVNNFASKEIQQNPGAEFRYNNMGLSIAGRILEIVSKKKFDMLAQQKLFRAMGMRQTSFSTLDGGLLNPDAGARSTANDMIRFMTMLLNYGVYKGQRILSEESVKQLRLLHTTSQLIKYAPEEANTYQYSLGAWAAANDGKQATVLTAPSLGGTLPVIDFCRGYAFIILFKELTDDQKANAYNDIKSILDGKFVTKCK